MSPLAYLSAGLSILFFLLRPIRNPCQKGLAYSFARTFIHSDWIHLLFNLYAFHDLSRILTRIAPNYDLLIAVITGLTVLGDNLLYRTDLVTCSIGYSGVVFGLITYLFMKRVSYRELLINLGYLLIPSLIHPRLSLTGHLLGVAAGAVAYHLV
jgi:membrane associated rhomboid family serine protease